MTVLQYSYFSVISQFPLETEHPFRNFLAVLPPPTLYKVETRRKLRTHASNIVYGVRGGFCLCELETPRNAKVSQEFVHDCSFSWLFHRLILPLSTCSFLYVLAPLVCYTAVFRVITQRSSPQMAAEDRTTFLSLCVCGLTNKPIRYKKFDST